MATIDNPKFTGLKTREQGILDTLRSSPTANAGKQPYNPSDIRNQQKLLKIKAQLNSIEDKEIADRWYDTEDDAASKPKEKPSLFWRTLDQLSKPLYTIAGAADYLAGTSPEKGFFESMNKNQSTNKRSFGNILQDVGAPKVVSAPLGLALDIAFDPVNWFTLGTAALVPRTVMGFTKGAAKGGLMQGIELAGKGAGSRLLETGLTVRSVGKAVTGKLRPSPSKLKALEAAAKGTVPGKVGTFMKGIEEKSLKMAAEYDKGMGIDILGNITKAGEFPIGKGSTYRLKFGDLVREVGERVPFMNKYFKYFDYNNAEWTRIAQIRDSLLSSVGEGEETQKSIAYFKAIIKSKEEGIDLKTAFEEYRQKTAPELRARIEAMPFNDAISPSGADVINIGPESINEIGETTKDIIANPDKFVTLDSMENGLRMAEEATGREVTIADIKELLKWEGNASGWEWWDNLRKKAVSSQKTISIMGKTKKTGDIMQSALSTMDKYVALFKRGAVGASPTAWTNAVIGNPIMAWMSGINIMDPIYMKRIAEGAQIRFGKSGPVLFEDFFHVKSFADDVAKNATLWKMTTGLSESQQKGKYVVETMLKLGKDNGVLGKEITKEELTKALGYMTDDMIEKAVSSFANNVPVNQGNLAAIAKGMEGKRLQDIGAANRAKTLRGEALTTADMGTGFLTAETFNDETVNKLFAAFEQGAKEGNWGYKLMDLVFNKLPDTYGGIDQANKLGTIRYLTLDGLTRSEFKVVNRSLHLELSDMTKHSVDGVERYKLNVAKSLELANEIYMNYAAMPAAVRVLRNLPLFGSPFAAFAYGMTLKTAKTAAYNPSVFNKVQMGVQEFGGTKSPLEKAVLSEGRYSYLDTPSMMKVSGMSSLPFFQTNSLYLNLENMIPFYSLNMFGENIERSYANKYSNAIIRSIDAAPFMKDPAGQVLFDFLIQPLVLMAAGDKSRSLNMFGQPILPKDSSIAEKIGYFARGVADPLIPGVVSLPAGLIQGAIAPGISQAMPSYKWRRIAEAIHGKTPVGKMGKEAAAQRGLRAGLGSIGIPIQSPVENTYLPPGVLQDLKNVK